MGMKKKLSTILLAAYAMGGGFAQGGFEEVKPLTDEEKKASQDAISKAKGLKEFEINGKIYLAINYKNALKKSKKELTNQKPIQ